MSIENPEKLLSIQDSLIGFRGDDARVLAALVSANNIMAKRYMNHDDYNLAIDHFSTALRLNETNMESKYGLLLAEGRALVKKGNKNGIWEAIEKYSEAILGIIDEEFKLSKIKVILTKCNPPITGFDGKVSIVRILENN